MLRTVDLIACSNRWRNHSSAVALLCLGLMLDAFLVPPLPGALFVLTAALLSAVVGARVPLRVYCRALLVPLGFLVMSALSLCWSFDFGGSWSLRYCPNAGRSALCLALRAWAATSVTLLFAFTVPVAQVMLLLRRLQTPTPLMEVIHLTYRSLFLMDEACTAIVGAQSNRLGYRSAPIALRSTGQSAAALFVRSVLQSKRLERGLYARGYSGSLAVLLPPSATRRRHLLLALVAAALVGAASWMASWTWGP